MYCFIGGTPDKRGALERYFPVGFYRGIDPYSGFVCSHSGCVCPHSGYVCCIIGGTPYKHGALECCFPVCFYRGIDPHSGFVCSHSGCLCCEEEEGERPWKTRGPKNCFPVGYTVVVCAHTVVMCVVL